MVTEWLRVVVRELWPRLRCAGSLAEHAVGAEIQPSPTPVGRWQRLPRSAKWVSLFLWGVRFVDGDVKLRSRSGGMMEFIQLWQEADVEGVY